jgi:hypothetical protein
MGIASDEALALRVAAAIRTKGYLGASWLMPNASIIKEEIAKQYFERIFFDQRQHLPNTLKEK